MKIPQNGYLLRIFIGEADRWQLKELLPEVKESLLLAILHERNILKFGIPPTRRK